MANVFDYLDWRGDLTFEQSPPNEVDSLILSEIAYVDFAGIVPETGEGISLLNAARKYVRAHRGQPNYVGLLVPPEVVSLMAKAAKTRRFGTLLLSSYVNRVEDEERHMQFCAMTFSLPNGSSYVVFRGTDDSIVGWKENFDMSFRHPVDAQREAVAYLETVAGATSGAIYMAGHSKGGNLSVYAAVRCAPQIKERIVSVYNLDGPGFTREFIEDPAYLSVRAKLCTVVPQSSVVGMLLEHEEIYEVVGSTETGLLQHNGFSWKVLGARFVHLDTVSGESRRIDRTVKQWVESMSPEEREAFVGSLYETIAASGAKTLTELNADKLKLVRAWGQLPPESRARVKKGILLLIRKKES